MITTVPVTTVMDNMSDPTMGPATLFRNEAAAMNTPAAAPAGSMSAGRTTAASATVSLGTVKTAQQHTSKCGVMYDVHGAAQAMA